MSTIKVYNIKTNETGYANSENVPEGWTSAESAKITVEQTISDKLKHEAEIQAELRLMAEERLALKP